MRIYEAVDRWNTSDSLTHYGVKGMKWGVRHDERNANELYKYKKKLEKAKKKYISVSDKTDRLRGKSIKLKNKINKNTRHIRDVASGRSNFGLWINRSKKVQSLANKNQKMISKHKALDNKIAKNELKIQKYSSRIKKYNSKLIKVQRKMQGVNVDSLNISDRRKRYIRSLIPDIS